MNDDCAVGLLIQRLGGVPRGAAELIEGLTLKSLLETPEKIAPWQELFTALTNNAVLSRAREDLVRYYEQGISCLALSDPDYPEALAAIHNPPPILFYRGSSPSMIALRSLAVIGSRKADAAAQRTARDLSLKIANKGVTVVSGLALGIDTVAHRAALEGSADLPTAAVLGGCLNSIYPAANSNLAREIIERGGTVMSQFEPGSRLYPSNFLDRNRVIAGLSRGVIVVQAGFKSGSLATARFAMEEGREVLVTPGPAFDDRYAGSNHLIRQGATLISRYEHLIESFSDLEGGESPVAGEALSAAHLAVLRSLVESPQHFERLRYDFGAEIDVLIMTLELDGHIARTPGNAVEITNLGRETLKLANKRYP